MKAIAELIIVISKVLRMLAELLLKLADGEVTEKDLQHQVAGMSQNFNPNIDNTEKPPVTFNIAKGKINMVVMVIWSMIEIGWIEAKDAEGKPIKDINKMKAANWMGRNLFGKPFKKWDQLVQYIFRFRTPDETDKFVEIFDILKELIKRRIKKV